MASRAVADKRWREWVKTLKEKAPLNRPVTVRRYKGYPKLSPNGTKAKLEPDTIVGSAQLLGGRFYIVVSTLEPKATQQETLLHEWAHCISYDAQRIAKTDWSHDSLFGVAYAYVQRQFYGESEPKVQ